MDEDPASTRFSSLDPQALEDDALRTAFGFDKTDDQWLAVIRDSAVPVAMGRLGPYRLLAELGRGGQAAVYKAIRDDDEDVVALKRLSLNGSSASAIARFEREREAVGMLSHSGIVGIRRVELIDGQPVLAMEFVDGQAIDRWASALPGRPVMPVVETFLKVCDAVAHAHRRGVLHRDLKPSNILVDAQGQPRVLDFGLAKLTQGVAPVIGAYVTNATAFLGTPAFASPEQVAGEQRAVDTRSDVYSLGLVLYSLLTGCLPLNSRAPLPQLFDQIRHGITQPPSAARPGLGRELDAIVLKAVALEPQRRYSSVDELAADLRRFLAGETVIAHPPTRLYKFSKLWHRHRLVAPVLVALAVAILILAVVSTGLALGLRSQRDQLAELSDSEHRARQAAEVALDDAKKQGEKHKAAAQFLSDLLNGVHNAYTEGQPLGSREMIDQAAARINAGELKNQPDVEASLTYAVGRALYDFGYPSEAEPYVLRAIEALRKLHGEENIEYARCVYMTGLLTESKGKVAEAVEIYTDARARVIRLQGEQDLLVALLDNNLGGVLRQQGKHTESEQAHRRALAVREKLRGPAHPEVGTSYRNLALTLAFQKRFEESHAAIDQAIAIYTQTLGPRHERTINCRSYLARILIREARFEESLALYRELLNTATELFGAYERRTSYLRGGCALALMRLNRWADAYAEMTAMLDTWSRLPQADVRPAALLCDMAECLLNLGRYEGCEARLKEAEAAAPKDGDGGKSVMRRVEGVRKRLAERTSGGPITPAEPNQVPPQ